MCPALRASTQHSCITWNAMTAPSFFVLFRFNFYRFSFPFTSDWEEEMEQPVCQDAFGQVLARGAQEWSRGEGGQAGTEGKWRPPDTGSGRGNRWARIGPPWQPASISCAARATLLLGQRGLVGCGSDGPAIFIPQPCTSLESNQIH